MPKAGSLGREIYEQPTAPVGATNGDMWNNGVQLRILIQGVWVNLGGPNVEVTS